MNFYEISEFTRVLVWQNNFSMNGINTINIIIIMKIINIIKLDIWNLYNLLLFGLELKFLSFNIFLHFVQNISI